MERPLPPLGHGSQHIGEAAMKSRKVGTQRGKIRGGVPGSRDSLVVVRGAAKRAGGKPKPAK